MYVSTLQDFVKAMRGELKITAKFPEGTVEITQFEDVKKADVGKDWSGLAHHRVRLSEPVFRFGRCLGRGAKKLHESFAGGLACSLLEKLARGFHHSNCFRRPTGRAA